jgi:hypothetical protein
MSAEALKNPTIRNAPTTIGEACVSDGESICLLTFFRAYDSSCPALFLMIGE